ncbi:hypothetical protein N7449_004391 [Penicillium cf. viridicatum]|uniref:Uncharacterized protein n=1 Tax=Penicillium cf. viridicatum TaxID=2972119 RepID=A0A9W9MJH3_9EURO|nr:hypothetical protein N7449_004391 [Penicillium cf. viridicatum]
MIDLGVPLRRKDIVIYTEAILKAKDERNARVIQEMLTNVGVIDDNQDTVLLKLCGRPDTTKHQQLRGLEDALRDDDFTGGIEI